MMELKVVSRVNEENWESVGYEIEVDGEVIGSASIMVSEEGSYLERIDIDENHRGRGFGTDAINKISSEFGGVYAAPDNEDSQRLFDRIGWDVSEKYWMVDQGYGVYEI